MKLPPAWLQSDDGTEAGLVPQDLPHDICAHWLGLRDKRKPGCEVTARTRANNNDSTRANNNDSTNRGYMEANHRLAVYLQSNPDPLGQRPLRKNCLNLWYNSAAEDASLRTNQIAVLLDA